MMDLEALADRLRRITVGIVNGGSAVGAGVLWAPEWIVTNAHVILNRRVTVRLADGGRADAVLVAGDREADLAVLRVPDLGSPGLFAVSDMPRVGSLIVAVGHPFGMWGALTTGIVHAVGPIVAGGRPWIQADLRLAPGNSGGPLADAGGQVLGLNAMMAGPLALAIPVSEVRRFLRAAGVAQA